MLSTEKRLSIAGYNLFQDNQDENLYHYLPSEKVKIAGNGSRLHFVAWMEGTVKEHQKDEKAERAIGGSLVLETELGPTDEELKTILEELKNEKGSKAKLVPVLIESGTAELIMFGQSGKDAPKEGEKEEKVTVRMFGKTTPSLCGKQTAAFSVKLGEQEAQVIWNLLHNTPQTQIAVKYELNYYGLRPACFLKIEVDFDKTDEYWEHHFNADLDFDYGKNVQEGKDKDDLSIVVAADVDVDVMFHELISNGDIKITNIDYTTDGTGSPIPADDPGALSIVKSLMSGELFDITPLPFEDYSALNNNEEQGKPGADATGKPGADATGKPGADAQKEAQATAQSFKDRAAQILTQDQEATKKPFKAENESNKPLKPTPSDTDQVPADNEKTTLLLEEFNEVDTDHNGFISKEEWEAANYPAEDYDELIKKAENKEKGLNEKEYEEYKKKKKTSEQNTPPTSDTENLTPEQKAAQTAKGNQAAQTSDKVSTIHFNADMKVGYRYKKRTDKTVTKRTYVFDKQKAQQYQYCPQGIISTKDTQFNPDEQVTVVRLGEGPFSVNEIIFSAPLNFDALGITEIGVELFVPYDDAVAHEVKMRKSEESIKLTKDSPVAYYSINAAPFSEMRRGIDYTVTFSFNSDSDFIGFPMQHPVFKVTFENVFDSYRQIDMTLLNQLVPRTIQAGGISFDEGGYQRADVLLYDLEKDAANATRTFKIEKGMQPKTILLNSEKEYRTEIEYTLKGVGSEGKLSDILCSGKKLKLLDKGTKEDDVIVEDPDRGTLLVHLRRGEDTFTNGIDMVYVTLRQGSQEKCLKLFKERPAMYFLYDPESDEDIEVVSVEIEMEDTEELKIFEPKQKKLSPKDSFELLLNIK